MDTDKHRLYRASVLFGLVRVGAPSGEWNLAVGNGGSEHFLSVFICVHLWLN